MKFLQYKGGRIGLDYDSIHDLDTTAIIELRDRVSALRSLRKLTPILSVSVVFEHPDMRTLWMNQGLENYIIEGLNSMIIKRRTKKK